MATLEYTNIDLVDLPAYTFSCVCLGEKLKFKVTYHTRTKSRIVQVNRDNGECILQSTYIYPNEPLNFNFNATRIGYLCNIELCKLDGGYSVYDMLNWSKNFFLCVSMTIADEVDE